MQWLEEAPKVFWQHIGELESIKLEGLVTSESPRDDDKVRGFIECLRHLAHLHDALFEELQANTQEDIDNS